MKRHGCCSVRSRFTHAALMKKTRSFSAACGKRKTLRSETTLTVLPPECQHFDGNIIVTDFGDTPPLGNIKTDSLPEAYDKWRQTKLSKELNCRCTTSGASTERPCQNSYYQDTDFSLRKARG